MLCATLPLYILIFFFSAQYIIYLACYSLFLDNYYPSWLQVALANLAEF